MRKLGIIGGTSWSSTALYYEQINRGVAQRLGGLHSARLVIESLDFAPIRRDAAGGRLGRRRTRSLVEAAKRLKARGADGLLLASNTMHKVYDEVAAAVRLPVLHIARRDRRAAGRRRPDAGRLARHALHHDRRPFVRDRYRGARHRSSRRSTPAGCARSTGSSIEELAAGRVVRDSQRKLKTLITELAKQKVQAVVLGCTELVLAVDVRANVLPVYDTTAIHARAAVDWMLEEEEQARAAA